MFETDPEWGFFVDLENYEVSDKYNLRKMVKHKIVYKYIPEITLRTIRGGEEKVHSFDFKKIGDNDIYSVKETNNFFIRVGIMIAGITISSILIIYKVV